jgi:hypothetical protein
MEAGEVSKLDCDDCDEASWYRQSNFCHAQATNGFNDDIDHLAICVGHRSLDQYNFNVSGVVACLIQLE